MAAATRTKAKRRIAVYTAIFGKKDSLITPKVVPPDCDFICFTDQPLASAVWNVRRVSPPEADPTRSARKYKILAHQFLPDYEVSIWVDGNMLIRGDVHELVERYITDVNIAVFDHAASKEFPLHSLEGGVQQLLRGKQQDDPALIGRQYDAYKLANYPDNTGLIWSLVLVRRHRAEDVVSAMEAWWSELTRWSKRDQMSFNYVAWKERLRFVYMEGDPADNPYFKRLNHYLPATRKIHSYFLGAMKRLRHLFGTI